jgi:hypothetical protein
VTDGQTDDITISVEPIFLKMCSKNKKVICKNQTPFKFLDSLENSNFRSVTKKVYEIHPNFAQISG